MKTSDLMNALRSLQKRVVLVIGRGIIKTVNDGPKLQICQASFLADELRDGVERMQEYGFTSVPLPGAEAISVFLGGNRDHGVIIACDDRRYRVKGLAGGEVCIYSDEGDKVHFKRNNIVNIVTKNLVIDAETKVQINTPLFEVNATALAKFNTPDVQATATITADGNIRTREDSVDYFETPQEGTMQGIRDVYNQHTHISSTPGSPTSEPDDLM